MYLSIYELTCAHVHICEVDLPAGLTSKFLDGIGLVSEIEPSVAFISHRCAGDPVLLVETRIGRL